MSVGGPALTYWVVPTEEELRSRYNPDLLKKSIEGRAEREAEFNGFVTKLKEYSKSDKPSMFLFPVVPPAGGWWWRWWEEKANKGDDSLDGHSGGRGE